MRVVALVLAALLSIASVGAPAPLEQKWSPHFPQLGQTVYVYTRMDPPPAWLCVGNVLRELGDRLPHERGEYLRHAILYRLSCRRPEGRIETFEWKQLIDGKYTVFAWAEDEKGNLISQPLDQEMVVR
jgi:hypothetical protein